MDFHWVDVFATGPLSGNPLVVVTGERMPPADHMQRLAAEFGVSETVFAEPASRPRLRIFTPEAEIPMAGHPLVGAAWVLRRIGWIGDEAVLSAPGGEVDVRADDQGARVTRDDPAPHGHADAQALAAMLGATAVGDAPIWHAGLPQAMLEVTDLDGLVPDHGALRAQGAAEGWAGVSAYVLRGGGGGATDAVAHVRHFAAPIGIPEDPVTGSAAAALGACLSARGMLGAPGQGVLTVLQGHHMGRPGRVQVRVDGGAGGPRAVTVGGAVVPVATGGVGPGTAAG